MFKRDVLSLADVINRCLRQNGLETPLLQKRRGDAWGTVAGSMVESYTAEKYIRNQVLYVKITSPALRSDLSMMRTRLVARLNGHVGSKVITDVRIY